MRHPIPPGGRDVLPAEMAELRRIEVALREVFAARGYGEVSTPAVEYDEVLARGLGPERAAPRFFDRDGELLSLRSDMTVPIARLVADRFADEQPPFRLHYFGSALRPDSRTGFREISQAGIELIGAPGPEGTIELIEVLVAALDAVGLTRAVVGLGSARLFRQLLAELRIEAGAAERILTALAAGDLAAIEAEAATLEAAGEGERELVVTMASLRGGAGALEQARELGGAAVERAAEPLARTFEGLPATVAERVQIDFGLLRELGYYTGAILEVYDPALGQAIGGGGRYDELTGRFGRPLPAAGFGLDLQRLHIAQSAAERLAREERG
jgi:ATP phosphoribosyltransferase regulatory subunit